MTKYKEVPKIISGKDLNYLSDMFEWNFIAYKKTCNDVKNVNASDIKKMLERGSKLFEGNLKQIKRILGDSYEQEN